jgi:hypothetical protein
MQQMSHIQTKVVKIPLKGPQAKTLVLQNATLSASIE